jgi:hypothetical protein
VNFASEIPPAQVFDTCKKTVTPYFDTCEVMGPLAIGLGGACSALAVFGGPAGVAFAGSCLALAADMTKFCLLAGEGFPPDGPPGSGLPPGIDLASGLCSGIVAVQNFFDPDGSTLTVTATPRNANPQTAQKTIAGNVSEVTFDFEFLASTSVLADFDTFPKEPAPLQGYTGLGTAQCLAAGANLSISISGTDGYSDATSCPAGNLACQLAVPGAAANVVDTLTFSASDGPTRTIFRTF